MGKTVFYIWQSDRPQDLNRFFIRDAARDAVEELRDELGIDLALDFDTWNVPGSPRITDVILEKLASPECVAVLADVTTVGRSEDPGPDGIPKPLQNPNVMFEMGFALAIKEWTKIVLVVNRAFGLATDLPFDLRGNRRPVEYSLTKASGTAKQVRSALTADLIEAIRLVVTAQKDWGVPGSEVIAAFEECRSFTNPSRFAPSRGSRAVLGLAIVPEIRPQDASQFFEALNRVYASTDLLKPVRATSQGSKVGGSTFKIRTGMADGLPRGEVQVSLNGVLVGGSTDILDAPMTIHTEALGGIPVFYVHRYLQALSRAGIGGQCWVQSELRGVRGLATAPDAPGETRVIDEDEIIPPPVHILLRQDLKIEDVAQRMKPITDTFWRACRGVNTPPLRL